MSANEGKRCVSDVARHHSITAATHNIISLQQYSAQILPSARNLACPFIPSALVRIYLLCFANDDVHELVEADDAPFDACLEVVVEPEGDASLLLEVAEEDCDGL